jgi:hypothetical protein
MRLHAARRWPQNVIDDPMAIARIPADMGGLAARGVRLATRPDGSLWAHGGVGTPLVGPA